MRIRRVMIGVLLMGVVGLLSGCHHFWYHDGGHSSHYGHYPYGGQGHRH